MNKIENISPGLLTLLVNAAEKGASDLFLTAGKKPSIRLNGLLETVNASVITAQELESLRKAVASPKAEELYRETGACDSGISLPDGKRFRLNFFMSTYMPCVAARYLNSGDNLDFETLNLPADALTQLASNRRGLILIAGSAGSGKSTTMSALVNCINRSSCRHIITIEDPVEYIHSDIKSLITRREILSDSPSFQEALKNAMRENPDVIVIGEMRDLDTMKTAISAALTGHLVISTIHTTDAFQSIERIINYFPDRMREQAAEDIAACLKGIVAQRLIRRSDCNGMVPANEILLNTPHIKNLISSRNFKELDEAIKRGHEEGMVTFTRAISDLYKKGFISAEDGASAATNRDEFLLHIGGMETGIETFRNTASEENQNDGRINMKRLLHSAVANGASDLILSAGYRPAVRFNGEVTPLAADPLTSQDTKRLLFSVMSPRQRAIFEETREVDFALTLNIRRSGQDAQSPGSPCRFRVNGFYQRGHVGIAVRVISQTIPSAEALRIPLSVMAMADKKQGLILVTGPTGHGKSTTLASMIDRINSSRCCHIITVEDPVEYVHPQKKAIVEQRELHADTLSFSNALKYVLRQDPDVILVGEMRDLDTIAAALTAAETGHLVLATLHTNDAAQTIDRIVDCFPSHQQNQVRLQLSGALLGIVAQRLIPRQDEKGRIAAFEVLVANTAIRALIRDGKSHLIKSSMETGSRDGMKTMEKSLKELYEQNFISMEEYMSYVRTADEIRK